MAGALSWISQYAVGADISTRPAQELNDIWDVHASQWRDPAEVVARWSGASAIDPKLFVYRISGLWWDVLAQKGLTLIVTREYEHLVMGLTVRDGRPSVTYLPLPHPSGLAADHSDGSLYVGSTRNPNQVYRFKPSQRLLDRPDVKGGQLGARPLVPVASSFFPGALYLHDLALIGGRLHGNAVGMNSVAELAMDGGYRTVWWPQCVDSEDGPQVGRNYIQLNSIAAGPDMCSSYFSASADRITARRPGQRNYPVDGRGVVFHGATRQVVVSGLTRPHSARLYGGKLWVANSGYGELVVAATDQGASGYDVLSSLPGWTRGLCIVDGIAFVGTSRVLPRFSRYAPGLNVGASTCGVHAVELASARILGSILWPNGNQIFAIDWLPRTVASGFPLAVGSKNGSSVNELFYAFDA